MHNLLRIITIIVFISDVCLLQINCNAHSTMDGRWGLGVVGKNLEGCLIMAATFLTTGFQDVAATKGRGVLHAIEISKEYDLYPLQIESYCCGLVSSPNLKLFPNTY